MLGYLLRKPQEVNGWLEVLERHLKRNENPKVWSAIMTDPQYLVQADEGRALKFLTRSSIAIRKSFTLSQEFD